MIDNTKHIIARLKLQPRHGAKKMSGIPTDAANVLGEFDTAFTRMSTSGLSLTSVLNDVYDSLDKLQTPTVAAVTGVQKLIGVYQQFSKIITDQTDQVTKLFQRNNELGKSFGLSTKAAQRYGFQLDQIAGSLEYGRANTEQYVKSLKGLLGVQALNIKNDGKFGTSLLKTQRYLTDIIGISEEAAEEMRYYNAQAAGGTDNKGKGIETRLNQERESAKLIGTQLGLTMDMNEQTTLQREIMEEIGDLGAEVQMQYGRYPATLGLAVMKAKQLGVSMAQLNKTGETLLSIESSVGDELEYQLLSGKRLVDEVSGKSLTNMYREAALQGDANKQADVMNTILDTQGDTIKDNMLARKQLAKTLGLEEDTLARMLQKRKLLSDIGAKSLFGKTGADLKTELEKLQKQGEVSTTQIDEIMKADDTRDVQTRMAEALESIQTRGIVAQFPDSKGFTDAFQGVSDSLENTLNTFKTAMLKGPDAAGVGGGYFKVVENMKEAVGTMSTFRTTVNGLGEVITGMTTSIPIWGNKLSGLGTTITDALATGLGTNLTDMTIESAENVTVPAAGGTGTDDGIIMNDGLIRFNPRDKFMQVNDGTMIAGTNVDGNRRLARQLSGGGGISDNQISRLAAAIASTLKETLPTVKMSVMSDPLYAANKLNRGRYS
jgi:hypothetical protein